MRSAKPRLDVRLRTQFDAILTAWGHRIYKWRWSAIVLSLAFFMGLASQAGKITIDVATDSFLRPDDPIRVALAEFRAKFGREEIIIISVNAPDIFNTNTLQQISNLHQDLEENLPHLDKVTSIINARDTVGKGDELIVGELLENWPQSRQELEQIKQRALANKLYENSILSSDGKVAALIVKISAYSDTQITLQDSDGFDEETGFDESTGFNEQSESSTGSHSNGYTTSEESSEVAAGVEEIVARHQAENFELHHSGGPVTTYRLAKSMDQDMSRFLSVSLLVIAILLFLIFKRLSAVLLSLFVILLSVSATLGTMAIAGSSMGASTQIMPCFLLAIGVSACIHLLTIFYRYYDSGHCTEDALAYTLGHSGLAIIMTSLTTAGAMTSFAFVDVAPVATLGIYTPIGIIYGLTLSLILLPALLSVTPLKRRKITSQKNTAGKLENLLVLAGKFAVNKPWTIFAVLGILIIISGVGISRLSFKYDPVKWYPKDDILRIDLEQIDKDLGGSNSVEAYIDTNKPGGVLEPEFLQRLLKAQQSVHQYQGSEIISVTKSLSIVDIVREINQALNGNDPAHFTIPNNRDLIAQEILLFENGAADDLFEFVDTEFKTTHVTFKVPIGAINTYEDLIKYIQSTMEHELGDQVSVQMTGFSVLMTRSANILASSLVTSYIIALFLITPLMIAVVGEVKAGLCSMIPNLTPIIFTLGLMGWMGIALDPFTLMIASIAIGLAVDDTIHFMQICRKQYDKTGDIHLAVEQTLRSTGRALLFTSAILSTAFFTYTLSSLNNLIDFGLLTGFAIIMAFLADITIAPALMKLASQSAERKITNCM